MISQCVRLTHLFDQQLNHSRLNFQHLQPSKLVVKPGRRLMKIIVMGGRALILTEAKVTAGGILTKLEVLQFNMQIKCKHIHYTGHGVCLAILHTVTQNTKIPKYRYFGRNNEKLGCLLITTTHSYISLVS